MSRGPINAQMYQHPGMEGYRKMEENAAGLGTGRQSLPGGMDASSMHASFAPSGAGDAGTVTTSGAGGAVSAEAGVDSGEVADGKRRKRPAGRTSGEKGKGLRHFSLKVCEKVESKGRTTYNEVADELVAEITGPDRHKMSADQQQYDEKNIRRRVYDALNVLMAMDIISKEKKEIKWKGLPPSSGSHEVLQAEKEKLLGRLEKKRASQQELQEQVAAIERLIRRNESNFQNGGTPPGSGVGLPFILVQTRPQATVEVEISEDMQLVHFDFGSTPFELHDDSFVLRAMGLANPPLDDVFPSGQGLASTSGVPGEASVALAATNSAPQPGMHSGYSQGMPQGAQGGGTYSTALTRSASAGQQQQLMIQQPVPMGQPGFGGQPVALPQQQVPMGMPNQPQMQQHQGMITQGDGQGYAYHNGQANGSGGMPMFGGPQIQEQHNQPMPNTQFTGQYGVPGFVSQGQGQFQQGSMPQQQAQHPQQMYTQVPAYQQQGASQMVMYQPQGPVQGQQYAIPGQPDQMGAYQQAQQQPPQGFPSQGPPMGGPQYPQAQVGGGAQAYYQQQAPQGP